jgi:hypothetical protein
VIRCHAEKKKTADIPPLKNPAPSTIFMVHYPSLALKQEIEPESLRPGLPNRDTREGGFLCKSRIRSYF